MTTMYPTADDGELETAIEAAAQAVQQGQLVILPTDTVYGIGADAFDAAAVQSLLDAKGRGRDMPPPVLVSAASRARSRGTAATPAVPWPSGCPTTTSPWRCSSEPVRWPSARPT